MICDKTGGEQTRMTHIRSDKTRGEIFCKNLLKKLEESGGNLVELFLISARCTENFGNRCKKGEMFRNNPKKMQIILYDSLHVFFTQFFLRQKNSPHPHPPCT